MTALAYENSLDTGSFDVGSFDVGSFDSASFGDPLPQRPVLRVVDANMAAPMRIAATPSVEVLRRRRFFALVAATTVVLAIAWAMGISITSFGPATADPVLAVEAAPAVHVVLPGDSYAAIAANLGAANPVAAAEELRQANGGAELAVGQRILVNTAALSAGS